MHACNIYNFVYVEYTKCKYTKCKYKEFRVLRKEVGFIHFINELYILGKLFNSVFSYIHVRARI